MDERLFHRQAREGDDPEYAALLADIPVHARIRGHLEAMWSRFRPLASAHWRREFPRQTHRRFWEMHLCAALLDAGLALEQLLDDAPDALWRLPDGRPVWFEAVAPDEGDPANPNSVPRPLVTAPGAARVSTWPEEQIILRLTTAIASKVRQRAERIARGRMAEVDPYVVALNAGRVPFASLDGLEPPIVVRAVFPVGHRYITLDRASLEVVGSGWEHRPGITKKPQVRAAPGTPVAQPGVSAVVPTTLFADGQQTGLSAVLYSAAHAGWYAFEQVGRWGDDFIVVHNPFAASPLPRGFFPRGREFVAEDAGDGTLELIEVGEVESAGP